MGERRFEREKRGIFYIDCVKMEEEQNKEEKESQQTSFYMICQKLVKKINVVSSLT